MNADSMTVDRFTEQEIFVGGELAKRQGKVLHYSIDGEIGIMDKALGQFRVHGNMDLNFRLGKDTVNLIARGFVTNTLPSFTSLSPYYHCPRRNGWSDNAAYRKMGVYSSQNLVR